MQCAWRKNKICRSQKKKAGAFHAKETSHCDDERHFYYWNSWLNNIPDKSFDKDYARQGVMALVERGSKQRQEPTSTDEIKKKRKNTHVACINCAKWHVSCETNRPCRRCVSKGLQASCIDAPRKKSKYLQGVPDEVLSIPIRKARARDEAIQELRDDLKQTAVRNQVLRNAPTNETLREQQNFQNPQHIIHKPTFLSSAADLEYSILSNIINKDAVVNRIPVNLLYSSISSHNPSSVDNSTNNSTINSPPPANNEIQALENIPVQKFPISADNCYMGLLGPRSWEIISSQVDLFANHFPLIPVESETNSLSFKRSLVSDPSSSFANANGPKLDPSIQQYYLNNTSACFPEKDNSNQNMKRKNSHGETVFTSISLQCCSPESAVSPSNPNWEHSLRYSTPTEIYRRVDKPFSHNPGFHNLITYLRQRFSKDDLVTMSRCLAQFRPIFIACSVSMTQEDMIFLEQCYQRTLLEYDKFISQIGTPTCVWRRNGQISYVNEEFEILTGWTRKELLNKMTFIVEIMDDETVKNYFQTFSQIAFKDYLGSATMDVCRLLSPIAGKTLDCSCMWTLKRDVSGLPLIIVANFMPLMT